MVFICLRKSKNDIMVDTHILVQGFDKNKKKRQVRTKCFYLVRIVARARRLIQKNICLFSVLRLISSRYNIKLLIYDMLLII